LSTGSGGGGLCFTSFSLYIVSNRTNQQTNARTHTTKHNAAPSSSPPTITTPLSPSFIFDGTRVLDDMTPQELDMEDGDSIGKDGG
jgi:hypothetical protein